MKNIYHILTGTAAYAAVVSLAFIAFSCEPKEYGEMGLSKQEVSADAGSMFVTVKSDVKWEFSVIYH